MLTHLDHKMDVVYGVIQDRTPGKGYSRVLLVNIGLKSLAFIWGLMYIFVDFKFLGKGLTMTRKQREAAEAQVLDPTTDRLTKRSVKPWMTVVTLVLLSCMIVSCWTLFMLYLVEA